MTIGEVTVLVEPNGARRLSYLVASTAYLGFVVPGRYIKVNGTVVAMTNTGRRTVVTGCHYLMVGVNEDATNRCARAGGSLRHRFRNLKEVLVPTRSAHGIATTPSPAPTVEGAGPSKVAVPPSRIPLPCRTIV